MKKIIVLLCSIGIFCACSDNKSKNTGTVKEEVTAPGTANEDKAIKEWLVGKEWKADNVNAPMEFIRVYSMDSCSFTAPRRYGWDFKNGRFIMIAEWPLKRVSDTSFTLFVEPTQKTYTFNFVRTL
ncbi:MAG: hypothetical protein ABI688_03010 [Bacteroidota bacterium]